MNAEELKAHRIAICKALADGRQCQLQVTDQWCDQLPETVAANLFSQSWHPERIRIKPEPRKCWVRWHPNGEPCIKPHFAYGDKDAEMKGYQLVVEDVK